MRRPLYGMFVGIIALVGLVFATQTPVLAQTAYTTQFVTSITYQNIGSGVATLSFNFYAQNSSIAIPYSVATLQPNAGASLAVGNVSGISSGFQGTAVIQSDQPVASTLVQVPVGSPVKNRPLSNGFRSDEGAADFLIPTVLKDAFDTRTRFSIQNVDTVGADIEVKFVSAESGNLGQVVHTQNFTNVPPNAAVYIDAGQLEQQLGSSFNGSAQISAKKTGTSNPGKVVAAALELSISGLNANGFEGAAGGVGGGSNTVYMPSAICNAFGGQQTAYAVQNVDPPGQPGSQNASVTVTYLTRDANDPTAPLRTNTFTESIPPGAKVSIAGCRSNVPRGHSGSAVITSTGAKIVAIGKVTGPAFTSASPGLTSGASKLALPYVRWSQTQYSTGVRQRTSIAIQNIGSTDLAAGAVTVKYYDKNGNLVGSHSLPAIPANAKVNSNPTNIGSAGDEFGYYLDGTFGGSAVIEGPSGSQLVALARVFSNTPAGEVGEDYNGIPIQ